MTRKELSSPGSTLYLIRLIKTYHFQVTPKRIQYLPALLSPRLVLRRLINDLFYLDKVTIETLIYSCFIIIEPAVMGFQCKKMRLRFQDMFILSC